VPGHRDATGRTEAASYIAILDGDVESTHILTELEGSSPSPPRFFFSFSFLTDLVRGRIGLLLALPLNPPTLSKLQRSFVTWSLRFPVACPIAMDVHADPANVEEFLPVVVLLKNVADSLLETEEALAAAVYVPPVVSRVTRVHTALVDMNVIVSAVLHDFRLTHARIIADEELGFWVRPRSTAWFSQFLLHEYDDDRWVANFRFTKDAMFRMASVLAPHCERQDTKFRRVVPIRVRVACALYKLVQGASLLICSKMFAIGQSTVSVCLRNVVHAVNLEFRSEISFPRGNRLSNVMQDFQEFCGLPAVGGAIDGTHIHIRKSYMAPEDYFYFKSSGYTIQCQAVVDRWKRFLDLVAGMPGSTHDSRMLRRSALYLQAESGILFEDGINVDGFTPYLLGDGGYPLKNWLMTPYRDGCGRANQRSMLDRLYNKRLSRGRSVVENAFGILKQSFRELLTITDLHVTFVPDVVVCCSLLHNVLLGQSPDEVARLLEILQREGALPEVDDDPLVDPQNKATPTLEFGHSNAKRQELGIYLGRRRGLNV
jgi:hypothetical protein